VLKRESFFYLCGKRELIQTGGRKHSEKLKEKRKQIMLSSIKLNNNRDTTSGRPEEQRMKSVKE
jgi:hypothetical protein